MSTATKPRKQKQFTFGVKIDAIDYRISPLAIAGDIGDSALRFEKLTAEGRVYDLHCNEYGWQCDCPGFAHYRHCKHVDAVRKLYGMLVAEPTGDADSPF